MNLSITSKSRRVKKHKRFSFLSDAWYSWLYRLFGYTPSFVGQIREKGKYYTKYYNPKTERFYMQDNGTGSLWEIV